MSTEEKIWSYLKAKGLTDAGAAGLMGNLYAESGLSPTNLQNNFEGILGLSDQEYTSQVDSGEYKKFTKDGAGYGLAQWTYHTRKAALLEYARVCKRSIGDLEMQLDFLTHELTCSFPAVLKALKAASSVRAASDVVLLQFERPADQSEAVKVKRAEYAQKYFDKYAHCSSLSVSVGQEVKRGDVIAAVGSTGNSTGPHLHLEIMLDGEYQNPYYFVDTGYDGTTGGAIPGTPGGVEIPAYPGEPVTDETYAAMLEEAQKYLGFPYVWGGSSPSTSFDCSGFVSWVINHSGWNVGRLGAQGLYNICTPVSMANAQPGDLIFFWHTYDAPNPNGVTHVGIYVGNGQMIHCGNPISYANVNSNYWQQHYHGIGRLT